MPGNLVLEPTGVAAGGDAIARAPDGRVVFVEGALPGERVRVEITEERRDFLRARLVGVDAAAPERIEPPCPFARAGCGGCQWQHISPPAQATFKRRIVVDALRRLARLADPPVLLDVAAVPARGYRTTLRLAVDREGRPAYRRRHSHDLVPVDSCLVAHPALEELVVGGRFPGAREVTLRVSAATGERLAVVHPPSLRAGMPPDVGIGGRIHEDAAGRRWRVSATSFFQAGPAGADLLVTAVRDAAAGALVDGGTVVDAYAGVGLLGGALAADAMASSPAGGVRVVAIESHPSAARDARANLAAFDVSVIQADVAGWRPPADPPALVVADPARPGLGRPGVAALAAAGAPVLVLVSCDPASLARDADLLGRAGYRLSRVAVVDLFPHTFHVETVSRFDRCESSR